MSLKLDTTVKRLGGCPYPSPVEAPYFIEENQKILLHAEWDLVEDRLCKDPDLIESFENAGPRRKIHFLPSQTKAAIVTCGGLCPGLNNVIQTIVRSLWHSYGVREIWGIPYGYEGLNPKLGHPWVKLDPDLVDDIHDQGGSILGASRGNQDIGMMVDTLVQRGVQILFAIGGDGTLKGASAIANEILRRGLDISVAGIPKTIDNDISYVDRTFGFETAVAVATQAVKGAHAEAKGYKNGIGLVKVMGRDSGFIAAYAALASNEANYVLVPEVRFKLEGPQGLLLHLEKRLERKRHAVILVAEGAGQEFFSREKTKDASGNILHEDIGLFLRDRIKDHFRAKGIPLSMKYIDPSYLIRSVPASADDAVFCIMLAQNAVHGAMAGKTDFMVGRLNNFFTFIPLGLATSQRKKIDPQGYLWTIVKGATGQPDFT
jgi:6-phosphofructokinase 1